MFLTARFIWQFFVPTLNSPLLEVSTGSFLNTPYNPETNNLQVISTSTTLTDTVIPTSFERSTAALNDSTSSSSSESPTSANTPRVSGTDKSFSFGDTSAFLAPARTSHEKSVPRTHTTGHKTSSSTGRGTSRQKQLSASGASVNRSPIQPSTNASTHKASYEYDSDSDDGDSAYDASVPNVVFRTTEQNEELDNMILKASTTTPSQPSPPRVTAGNRRVAIAQKNKSSEGSHLVSLALSTTPTSIVSHSDYSMPPYSTIQSAKAQASTSDDWASEMFSDPALHRGPDLSDIDTKWPLQAPHTSERKMKGLPRRARSGPGINTATSVTVAPQVIATIPGTQSVSYPAQDSMVNGLQYSSDPADPSSLADYGVVDYTVYGSYASPPACASGSCNEQPGPLPFLAQSGQSTQPGISQENACFPDDNTDQLHVCTNDQFSGTLAATTAQGSASLGGCGVKKQFPMSSYPGHAMANDANGLNVANLGGSFYPPGLEFDGQNWVVSTFLTGLNLYELDQSDFPKTGDLNTAVNTLGYTLVNGQDCRIGSEGSTSKNVGVQMSTSSPSGCQNDSGFDFLDMTQIKSLTDAMSQEQRHSFFQSFTDIIDSAQASQSTVFESSVSKSTQDYATINPQALLQNQTAGLATPPEEPLDSMTSLVKVTSSSPALSPTSNSSYTESDADTVAGVTTVVKPQKSHIDDTDELTDADATGEDEDDTEPADIVNLSASSPTTATCEVHGHPRRPRKRTIKRSSKNPQLRFKPYPNPESIKTKRTFVLDAAEVQPTSCEHSPSVGEDAQESDSCLDGSPAQSSADKSLESSIENTSADSSESDPLSPPTPLSESSHQCPEAESDSTQPEIQTNTTGGESTESAVTSPAEAEVCAGSHSDATDKEPESHSKVVVSEDSAAGETELACAGKESVTDALVERQARQGPGAESQSESVIVESSRMSEEGPAPVSDPVIIPSLEGEQLDWDEDTVMQEPGVHATTTHVIVILSVDIGDVEMKDVEPYFKIDSDVVMADPDHDVNGYYDNYLYDTDVDMVY